MLGMLGCSPTMGALWKCGGLKSVKFPKMIHNKILPEIVLIKVNIYIA